MEKLFYSEILCILHFLQITEVCDKIIESRNAAKKRLLYAYKTLNFNRKIWKKRGGKYYGAAWDEYEIYLTNFENAEAFAAQTDNENKWAAFWVKMCYDNLKFSTRNFTKFSAHIDERGNIVINAA